MILAQFAHKPIHLYAPSTHTPGQNPGTIRHRKTDHQNHKARRKHTGEGTRVQFHRDIDLESLGDEHVGAQQ